jgi:hypothetical protein
VLNEDQIKQIEELGNKPINTPILDKKNIFNKTDTNLFSLSNNLVCDKFSGNDIKLFNGISQQKANFNVHSTEPKSILNNNSINIFNNFNNSVIENQKQNLTSNNVNLNPSNIDSLNNLTNINRTDNDKLNNNLLNLSFFPSSILNENKEILKKLDNESYSYSINKEKCNINELTNEDKISENTNKPENVPKLENLIKAKNLPININPIPNNGFINELNIPMNRLIYPGLNQLALFSTLNNNLLLCPNPINNPFGNLINFNPPIQLNMPDNNNNLIGKKRI